MFFSSHILVAVLLPLAILAVPFDKQYKIAEQCNRDLCQLPACRCAGLDVPGGLKPEETPQFVYLTFDDAININNMKYYHEFFDSRQNPNGCPIAATFFLSHEYTDYSMVHELHSMGHEIALHSITHTPMTEYWKKLNVGQHLEEFGGGRELISHFANIDIDELKGVRLPLLQQSGNNSYDAALRIGLTYDCSWPTLRHTKPGLWPYTMDYKTMQDCPIGPCPDASYPGLWIQPMIDLIDNDGNYCAMVDACINPGETVDELYEFLVRNFENQYTGNRAPFGVYMHAAWFDQKENAKEAYVKFLDHLQQLNDVYIVKISQGLEWVRQPTPLQDLSSLWPDCPAIYEPDCDSPQNCPLQKGEEERYMMVCSDCPDVYPWLGNPLGKE